MDDIIDDRPPLERLLTKARTAPKPTDTPHYSEIEAVVRRLPVCPQDEFRIRILIDQLAIMGFYFDHSNEDGTAPPHFRPANEKMIRNELTELGARARELAKKIEADGLTAKAREKLGRLIYTLHEPTICALADVVGVAVDKQPVRPNWAYFRLKLPKLLATGNFASGPIWRRERKKRRPGQLQ